MPLSTHIEGLTSAELLRIISNSGLSGAMSVLSSWRVGRIVFKWGRIVHASATGQRRVGEMLVDEGVVSPQDLEQALEVQKTGKKMRPLGSILVAQGAVDQKRMHEVLERQMKAAFFEILDWDEGVVHVELEEDHCASIMIDTALDTQTLLFEAARRTDESQDPSRKIVHVIEMSDPESPLGTDALASDALPSDALGSDEELTEDSLAD